MFYIIRHEDGRAYCNDKRWRDFSGFGNVSGCFKTYRSKGGANSVLNRMNGLPGGIITQRRAYVLCTPKGFHLNASLQVFAEKDGNDYIIAEIKAGFILAKDGRKFDVSEFKFVTFVKGLTDDPSDFCIRGTTWHGTVEQLEARQSV